MLGVILMMAFTQKEVNGEVVKGFILFVVFVNLFYSLFLQLFILKSFQFQLFILKSFQF